jgi:hypothetical protein
VGAYLSFDIEIEHWRFTVHCPTISFTVPHYRIEPKRMRRDMGELIAAAGRAIAAGRSDEDGGAVIYGHEVGEGLFVETTEA